jgi:uncharacterized membrane protein (UPF0127 family)
MSRDFRVVVDADSQQVVLARARWCAGFWCHLVGLQFRRDLPDGEGLLFVTHGESIVGTTIHMFNVYFSIGVVWLDASGVVVDATLAKPWRPYYAPAAPAQYYIEAKPDLLDHVQVGQRLNFAETAFL